MRRVQASLQRRVRACQRRDQRQQDTSETVPGGTSPCMAHGSSHSGGHSSAASSESRSDHCTAHATGAATDQVQRINVAEHRATATRACAAEHAPPRPAQVAVIALGLRGKKIKIRSTRAPVWTRSFTTEREKILFILFYFILFYFILFYFILFYKLFIN